MDENAQEAAWHRIETALARLDTAARRLRERSAPDTDLRKDGVSAREEELSNRLREEQARHAALREALHDTLTRMDALIVTHGQERQA